SRINHSFRITAEPVDLRPAGLSLRTKYGCARPCRLCRLYGRAIVGWVEPFARPTGSISRLRRHSANHAVDLISFDPTLRIDCSVTSLAKPTCSGATVCIGVLSIRCGASAKAFPGGAWERVE